MKALLRTLFDFLLYGNFFIALCAVAMTLQTCHLRYFSVAGVPILIFIFASTFFLYNIHKFITVFLKKEKIDNQRFMQLKRFDAPLSILTFIAFMSSFDTFMQFRMDIKKLVAIIGIFSLAYVLPVFNGKRLRDISYIKIFFIVGAWVSVCVVLPAIALGKDWWTTDAILALEKACFIFAITIPFDIRDRAWDAQLGVKTIPLLITMGSIKASSEIDSVKKTLKRAYIALIISFLMACILVFSRNYSFWTLFKIGISLLITYFVIKQTDEKKGDYFYAFWVDGMMLLQSLIVILL